MFREHEQIVLTDTVYGDESEVLKPGTKGTVIHVHPRGTAYVVEFPLNGDMVSIATVMPSQASLAYNRGLSPGTGRFSMGVGSVVARFRSVQHSYRTTSKRHRQSKILLARRSRVPAFKRGAKKSPV